ncbi:hypothetical protein K449DRAFT_390848 [Hypoxylon sp. EC38]|nr:hypothetical protein K449DRAFT_390848 [Hypoxylon sp. EC38]
MPPTNYTPILPALPPGQDAESFFHNTKRPNVNIACESCRKSKSRESYICSFVSYPAY